MTTATRVIPRAETVGSLLRPPQLLTAMDQFKRGDIPEAELHELQDDAVREAIEQQESAGLDVITDGEMRRNAWVVTTDIVDCFEQREVERMYPASARLAARGAGPAFTVVRKVDPAKRGLGAEYGFLREHAHSRTKYTVVAPSYHRRYWTTGSPGLAYDTCEEFLQDIRDWMRGELARLVEQGCDYIQLDAPNYGSLCDPETREFHAANGRDVDADIAFDAELDSSVFDGLSGVTRALHVCRGNFPGGAWHSSGGYASIAEQLFPRLRVDTLLLEYDSDRAGDFEPLRAVPDGTVCVLGLLTTKSGEIEDEEAIAGRIKEATQVKPLSDLALSTQCGFASVAGDNPTAQSEQRAKLELIGRLARRVWS